MHPLDRLEQYLRDHALEAVWFGKPTNFAWLTGGDNTVSRNANVGVAAAGYDGQDIIVVTDNIEASRLKAEELDSDVRVETFEWYESSLVDAVSAVSPRPAAADFDVPGFDVVNPSSMRHPLAGAEIDRYRALGEATAEVLEQVCRSLAPTDTERAVAARLRGALAERNIDAPVTLVGGGDRATSFRHFTPKDAELDEYALLSVTAVRNGLHASATRTVTFDPPQWLHDRTEAAMRVEVTALAATRAVGMEGGVAADVFTAIEEAYKQQGWEGEWRNHHQGGAAGYDSREWFATPTSAATVTLPMAYAWNPTVQGAKSEDTVLLTDDGIEILTSTNQWPTRQVDAIGYDLTLRRPEPVHQSR